MTFFVEKLTQNNVPVMQFSTKLPKVNTRPRGENWPNLVTLLVGDSVYVNVYTQQCDR
jgi:hypothetical protein